MSLIVVTFKAPDFLVEELDRLAIMMGRPRSELIRYAIAELLRKHVRDSRQERIRVRRVKLSPPSDEVRDGGNELPPYKTMPKEEVCREIEALRQTKSWAEVAEALGFNSKHTADSWYRRNCVRRW